MRSMNKSNFEKELEIHGVIVYPNVGISMLPLIRQGKDLMVIRRRPAGRLKKYDAVLYKRNDSYIMHRILKVCRNGYVICGDNCYTREYGVTDAQIIGVLTAIIRNGREISVEDKRYQIYVHLWCDLFPFRAMILRGIHKIRRVLRQIKEKYKHKKADI